MRPAGNTQKIAHPTFPEVLSGTAVARPLPPVAPREEGERSMPKTPDEDHDVIVHWCSGAWEIRLGDELHGLRFTLTSALERACDVATVHRRPCAKLSS